MDPDATGSTQSSGVESSSLSGQVISHYRIDRKLGQGGMGVVYEALDLRLHRLVALKFLHPRLTHSREQVAALEREALAISALNHPNIATIYGIEEANEYKFLVLEYLPGGTLKSKIESARARGVQIPLDEALECAIQIVAGLAHAHDNGIIHRDIKSSNILFTAQGSPKLADFSLASSDYHSDTACGTSIVGTPASMSPEQAQGKDLDHRSDIFSVGIVLFELFTGEMPFRAHGNAAVLEKIIWEPAPRLSQFRPGIAVGLESIICTALQKDRGRRYQQANTLGTDLQSIRHQARSITGEETARDTATIPSAAVRHRTFRTFGLISLLLTSSLAMYEMPFLRRSVMEIVHRQTLPAEKRLVVLNFTGSGSSPEFRDGLMDVISSKLTEMEQFQGSLLVISPSEVRKAEIHTPSEAREAFGATLAITGTVGRTGGGPEVTINLVDTETLAQLRSFSLGIDVPDPLTLQAGLASKAGEMLEIGLGPTAVMAVQAGYTPMRSAYRHYVEGRGYLQRIDQAEYPDKAITAFREAIRLDGRYALAYAGLAQAWLERWNAAKDPKAIDEAMKNASQAVELNGKLTEVHVTIGRVFSAKGMYEEAEREFRQVLAIDPVNAEAYRRLARNYERLERRNDAESTYRRAIQLRPNDWRGYQYLGNYNFNHGNMEQAVRNYQRVLQLTPGNYNAYNDLGAAYLRLNNYPEAEKQLKKSVQLKPVAMNCSNLGSVYYFQCQYREAARWYEKAVAANGTNSSWWGNLADAYRETPELAAKAPDAYRKAVSYGLQELEANARNGRLRSRVAYYYAAVGDSQSASREVALARRATPGDSFVLFRASLVYELLHNRDDALTTLAAAIRAGYPMEEIRQAPALQKLRADPRYQPLENIKTTKEQKP